jgi:hypothetical protein
MKCARYAFAATLVGAGLVGSTTLAGQAAQAPAMTLMLSGKTFTQPAKGPIEVEFTKPVTKKEKDMVVTRLLVRNAGTAPIARLTVSETWYDKGGAPLVGGKGVLKDLLQPGEVRNVLIETPWKAGMSANNYNFSHANGTVKPKKIDELIDPSAPVKEPAAAKPAAARKK